MIGSESMSLFGWKQLAKWSLEHSCMEPPLKKKVKKEWERRWEDFCYWIVEEFSDDEQLEAWRTPTQKQEGKL